MKLPKIKKHSIDQIEISPKHIWKIGNEAKIMIILILIIYTFLARKKEIRDILKVESYLRFQIISSNGVFWLFYCLILNIFWTKCFANPLNSSRYNLNLWGKKVKKFQRTSLYILYQKYTLIHIKDNIKKHWNLVNIVFTYQKIVFEVFITNLEIAEK